MASTTSYDTVRWQEWEGRIVPRAFAVGYIVLSYVVSYVGAWTTLELMNRRTSGRGLYNWYAQISPSHRASSNVV